MQVIALIAFQVTNLLNKNATEITLLAFNLWMIICAKHVSHNLPKLTNNAKELLTAKHTKMENVLHVLQDLHLTDKNVWLIYPTVYL